MSDRLVANPKGGYRFLPGGFPYSSGVIATEGHEIVHVTLTHPLPWREGLESVRRSLESIGCERHALCAVELRCPEPFPLQGFLDFNKEYRAVLEEWDMLVDGENPVARTNVSPVANPPEESMIYGFSYTEASEVTRPTFVISGAGEILHSDLEERRLLRLGETSEDAMLEKAACVVEIMGLRLDRLGAKGEHLTSIDVYTAHPLQRILDETLIAGLPAAAGLGVRWFYSRPPVIDIEFEMDMRGVRRDIVL